MDLDDLEPRAKKPAPKNLDEMSLAALEDYIAGLETEIARARAAIAAKRSSRQGAETFFKKK
ncbi:MAG: DUF1192 domain-containing protein [Rhodospirillales bacterium RIFCSPLOWO2_12_FULL_67_15]|nr:MAG: DUF1192 domain-containing protein [Rhodospirillales bacterium RIFCSPLOWO2_12_FULL_67_15]